MKRKILVFILILLTFSTAFTPLLTEATNEHFSTTFNEEADNFESKSAPIIFKEDMSNEPQYTIFLVDTSYTTRGNRLRTSQRMIREFSQMAHDSMQNHQIAIISFDNAARVVKDFTNSQDEIEQALSHLESQGRTNLYEGLQLTESLLESLPRDAQKNILLISDRTPTFGKQESTGVYTRNDIHSFRFANAANNQAFRMKKVYGATFRTFVYMDFISSSTRGFAQRFFENIQTHGFHSINHSTDFDFLLHGKKNESQFISGTFSYGVLNKQNNRDAQAVFHYSDSYFNKSAYAYRENETLPYNPSLATMSLNLQLSSWASTEELDYAKKSRNAQELLEKIGFEHFKVNHGFLQKPEKDSIGAVAAQKKIIIKETEYTLVALSIRGGGYEKEWASNLTMGIDGNHQGFNEASLEVLEFLNEYIEETNIQGNVKLWVTGFSRAAAVSNLVAGKLNNKDWILPFVEFSPENMYVFCFEPPAGVVLSMNPQNNIHRNIINIINENDIVTKVAPVNEPFNFRRFGVDVRLPIKEQLPHVSYVLLRDRMLRELGKLETKQRYVVDNFQSKRYAINIHEIDYASWALEGSGKIPFQNNRQNNISLWRFLDENIPLFSATKIKSRENYVHRHQEHLRNVIDFTASLSPEQREEFFDLFLNRLLRVPNSPMLLPEFATSYSPIVIENILRGILSEMKIDDFSEQQISGIVYSITELLLKFFRHYPDVVATFIGNASIIKDAHHPELCLAWLRSQDENYTRSAPIFYKQSDLVRKIAIQGSVQIFVTSENGEIVKKLDNTDEYFSEIYLSVLDDFEITVESQEKTEVVFVSQIIDTSSNQVIQTENFPKIFLDEKENLKTKLSIVEPSNLMPAILATESLSKIIKPKQILLEEEASSYLATEILIPEKKLGSVFGGGLTRISDFTILYAIPEEHAEFLGWYKGNQFLGNELELVYKVDSEETIIAKFTEKE